MAEPSDEPRPEDEHVAGGAVKSFLEHLEDLRWMLIKIAAATIVGMMVCLFGVNYLAAVLKWPLERARHARSMFMPADTNTIVQLRFGGQSLQTVELKSSKIGGLDLGTNHHVAIELVPTTAGSNTVFALNVIPDVDADTIGGPELYYMGPADSFLSMLHMAFFGGLFLASPFVLYFIGQFVMPALKIVEKKYFLRAFWAGLGLFLSGVSFAYFVIMPPAIKFAQVTSNLMGISSNIWKAEDFFSFEVKFMLGMGLGFELPVVLLALVKIGVLDYAKLKAMRRYMVVGNLVLGALLTTPEVFTQLFMAVALQVLFEAAVWIAWYWEREAKKKAAAGTIDV